MMLADRRTKIVATIGPATNSRENLKKLILAGMNVARLNFSHGNHADHLKVIENLRSLSEELKAPLTILQDLQGPKIRVGKFKTGSTVLVEGEQITITTRGVLGEGKLVPSDFKELHDVCKPGTKILLDDGLLELRVDQVDGTEVLCTVIFGGTLKDRKGMNIPGAFLPVECMTSKDLIDLDFGLENKVDYVALSFVRRGEDIEMLKSIIIKKAPGTRIVAKIEMLGN